MNVDSKHHDKQTLHQRIPYLPMVIQTFGILLIAYLSYLYVDLRLTISIDENIKGTNIQKFFTWITPLGESHYYLIISAGYFIFYRHKKSLQASRAKYIFMTVATTGCIINMIKVFFGRYRPSTYFKHGLYGFSQSWIELNPKYLSFPSGHTITAFSLAFCASTIQPKYRIYYYTTACILSLSRVIVTAHYLSDVIVGAWLGIIISQLITQHSFSENLC